ncbi:PREDICTED: inositol polyphosphate multikinase [Nanorana parkeri]|uniref:inositol polyphosphate multikinase n=1 Tax=Nanorana parkeri TaxID=125878 RepID=UPI0008545FF5|nr:PREDICTED: inositol polyphosphate multikinase [Nanorana parkeri]
MATQHHHRGAEPPGCPDLHQRSPGDKNDKLLNGCVPLSHQVAGHMYGKDKVGILQHPDGTVLKQLQPPPRGPRELDFYNMVFSSDCTDPKLRDLRTFLPKYFGTWSPPGSADDLYLKLEDVTRKFNKPCIMDVKIGQKSYDPYASAEKVQQQISKYPLMEEIGFLVLGMRVYHVDSDSFETENQHYGRRLTKETVKEGISKFFNNGCCLRKDAVAACLLKVKQILHWFEHQDTLNFYASSLLFVYDGSGPQTNTNLVDGKVLEKVFSKELFSDVEVPECNNNINLLSSMSSGKGEEHEVKLSRIYTVHKKTCPKRPHSQAFLEEETVEQDRAWKSHNNSPREHLNGNLLDKLENVFCHVSTESRERSKTDVRMIDFAHVFPSNEKDAGYIYGLKNVIVVLQSILNE